MPVLALADILIAVVVAVLLIGSVTLAFIASRVIPDPSFLGFHPFSWVQSALRSVAQQLGQWGQDAMGPLAWMINGVAMSLWWLGGSISNAVIHAMWLASVAKQNAIGIADDLYNQAVALTKAEASLLYNIIGYHYQLAINEAESLYSQAMTALGQDYNALSTAQTNYYNSAVGIANGYFTQAEADISSLKADVATMDKVLTGGMASAVATLAGEINKAEADAVAGINAAIAQAQATAQGLAAVASAGAVSGLNTAAHDAVIGPWQALLPQLSTVAGALDPAVSGTLGLPGVLTEPVPLSVPGILSMVVPALAGVATEVAECVVPTCSTLKPYSQFLSGIGSAALYTLLAALVAEAVSDPGAAVSDLVGVGATVQATSRDVLSIFGM